MFVTYLYFSRRTVYLSVSQFYKQGVNILEMFLWHMNVKHDVTFSMKRLYAFRGL